MRLIAIDPGAQGGIAIAVTSIIPQNISCYNMPNGMREFLDLVCWHENAICYMEKTGKYMPGNSAVAACTFARHCGQLEGLLYASNISVKEVPPTVWQKSLGTLPKDKKQRKNAIKNLMQQRYPHLKVTLYTADALGILTYALEKVGTCPKKSV